MLVNEVRKVGQINKQALERLYQKCNFNISQNKGDYYTHHELDRFFLSKCMIIAPEYKDIWSFSWYGKIKKNHCTAWHIDFPKQHFFICSYPYPTQIVLSKNIGAFRANGYPNDFCTDIELKDKDIKYLTNTGQAEVFVPKVGEIYLVGADIIHRTNPKSYGLKHMVLRCRTGETLE